MSTENKLVPLRKTLESALPKLAEVAPKYMKPERIIRLLLAATTKTPKILDCTQESILNFCMTCSQTGLEPVGAGGIWPIPYGTTLTALIDYRGMVNVAKNAGCIKDAYAEPVYEKDDFDYALGMEPYLVHKPARGERGKLEAAYCIIAFPDGTKRFVVMHKEDILGIKKRSKASTSGPWVTDEAQMWCKTVVRRAMKPFAGASPEMDAAIAIDDKNAGVIDVTPKEPIAMPKQIEEPKEAQEPTTPQASGTPAEPQPEPEGTDTKEQPKDRPEGVEEVSGKVVRITPKKLLRKEDSKKGDYKKGDKYFMFTVELEDGSKYSTFSETEANKAEEIRQAGWPAKIVWKASGAYRNLISIHN